MYECMSTHMMLAEYLSIDYQKYMMVMYCFFEKYVRNSSSSSSYGSSCCCCCWPHTHARSWRAGCCSRRSISVLCMAATDTHAYTMPDRVRYM